MSSSAFIGSGCYCLKNNNTHRLEIKIKKIIIESLLKPTRGNVLKYQKVNTTPCSKEKTRKRKPDYSKLYTEY
jgi:hypothetical protein